MTDHRRGGTEISVQSAPFVTPAKAGIQKIGLAPTFAGVTVFNRTPICVERYLACFMALEHMLSMS